MNSTKQRGVRVRFAPSPTGQLHIGNVRTALFNWLFARHNKGTFLVRIEDTDRERSKPAYTTAIIDALAWLGIEPDESIVFQSERIEEHTKVLHQLLDAGKAYRCYCSQEDIVARYKKRNVANERYIHYDGHCREIDLQDSNRPHVIRFALPRDITTLSFIDLIRGEMSIALEQFDDFIIARSDGSPVYNFVVVVDDAFMGITHILRGEDHLINTYKQILLYQACGYRVPAFAHLPMILGPGGDRLSKRDAAMSIQEYKQEGYLPEALFNYLVRLGWAHGDQEVFSRQELVKYFSLEQVGKKGSVFDLQKLQWLNGVYIREMTAAELLASITNNVDPDIADQLHGWPQEQRLDAIMMYKDRVKTLKELVAELKLLHDGPTEYVHEDMAKWITAGTVDHLDRLLQKLEERTDFTVELVKRDIKELAHELDLKLVNLAQPIRLALVGKSASPGVFELLAFLGKQESVRRLRALLMHVRGGA